MLNQESKLSAHLFEDAIEQKPTRDGFGTGAVEAGKANAQVVVLCADLAESTRAEWFQKEFPDRFVELGVAEQNMATVAAGMALAGKVPFITSYATFSPGRNYEQIRTTIALNEVPVKVCGMHAGVSVGPDGATHQMLEDIGMMRMLPNMTVIAPGDAIEAHKAVVAAAQTKTPVYLRFARAGTPVFTTDATPFEIGKALSLWDAEGATVALLATGSMSYRALEAAQKLSHEGVHTIVLHVPTIKPLDKAAVLGVAERVKTIITIEEHQAAGGFGSAIAEVVAAEHPIRVVRMGIQDMFGQSGEPQELLEHYGLSTEHIIERVRTYASAS